MWLPINCGADMDCSRFNLHDNYFASYERKLYTTSNLSLFALPWPPQTETSLIFKLYFVWHFKVHRCNRRSESLIMKICWGPVS